MRDSYVNATLLKLVQGQERLNQVDSAATQARERVESLTREEEAWFARRRERELVKMRLAVLRSQLADTEREESEGECVWVIFSKFLSLCYSLQREINCVSFVMNWIQKVSQSSATRKLIFIVLSSQSKCCTKARLT